VNHRRIASATTTVGMTCARIVARLARAPDSCRISAINGRVLYLRSNKKLMAALPTCRATSIALASAVRTRRRTSARLQNTARVAALSVAVSTAARAFGCNLNTRTVKICARASS